MLLFSKVHSLIVVCSFAPVRAGPFPGLSGRVRMRFLRGAVSVFHPSRVAARVWPAGWRGRVWAVVPHEPSVGRGPMVRPRWFSCRVMGVSRFLCPLCWCATLYAPGDMRMSCSTGYGCGARVSDEARACVAGVCFLPVVG